MKRRASLALSWVILLAFIAGILFTAAAMIASHQWFALLLYAFAIFMFIGYIRLLMENLRLKKQLRELEIALGL